jgi:hypothetical protein
MAGGRRRAVFCEMKCKRRGPIDNNCPSMVTGIAADCRKAEKAAKHSVPAECWADETTYGHCKRVNRRT